MSSRIVHRRLFFSLFFAVSPRASFFSRTLVGWVTDAWVGASVSAQHRTRSTFLLLLPGVLLVLSSFLSVFLSLSSRSNRFHSDSVHDARRYEAIEPRSFRGLELEISHSREYHLARVNERVHGTFPSNRFPTIVFRLMSFSPLTLIRHYRGIKRTL